MPDNSSQSGQSSLVLALLDAILLLLHTLALKLLDHVWWAVLDEIGALALVQTSPLWKSVWHVHDTLSVEHVQSWPGR